MTTRTAEASPLVYARVAGLLYLVIIVFAGFGEIVRSNLIVIGNATATAENILASEGLFRIGLASDLVAFLSDAAVAVLLYVLLRPVSRTLSLIAASFRLVHATISGLNLLNQFAALLLLSGAGYLTVFEEDQLHALVLLFLSAHNYGYLIGLTFFGLSLLVLGYLIFRSGYFPRALGVLVILGSLGYLLDGFTNFLLPDYAGITDWVVVVTAVIAEVSLAFWLLIRGVNVRRYYERTQEPH